MMRRSLLLLACLLALSWQVRSQNIFEDSEDDFEVEGSSSIPGDDEDMTDGSGSGSSITFDGKYDDEKNLFTNPNNSSSTTTHTSVAATKITLTEGEPDVELENPVKTRVKVSFADEPEISGTTTTTIATVTENIVPTEEPVSKDDGDLEVDSPVAGAASIFASAHFMTALIVGGCVGLLFAICVIMLLAYRMRKKDEGSYALDEQKKPASPSAYQYTQGQEYYA